MVVSDDYPCRLRSSQPGSSYGETLPIRMFIPRDPDYGPFDLFKGRSEDDLYVHNDGAYVFASNRKQFAYPLGTSPVFYIRKRSENATRLAVHKREAMKARDQLRSHGRFQSDFSPRYTYAARFGAQTWWFTKRGTQTAEQLEASLLRAFYERFGAIPVTNGAWPR